MSSFPYQFFEEFVVRTPLFSYKTFIQRLSKDNISDSELKKIYSDVFFQEAVYLASPALYKELRKFFLSEKELSQKDQSRLKNTLLKYYSRISSRCTPFGLFAGVGVGKFNKDVSLLSEIDSSDNNIIRDTKLDMHFLVLLSQHFAKIPEIKEKLLYFPNTSIYKVRDKIRYTEYEYNHGRRQYIVSTVLLSKELEEILEFSEKGKTISQITNILVKKNFSEEEVKEFIGELIDNQVLLSELEPHVSGGDFLSTLISLLKDKKIDKYAMLSTIWSKLETLDKNLSNDVQLYHEIESLIKSFHIEYESKFLFQTDLYHQNKIELPNHWKKELKTGISFLNKITPVNKQTYLEGFKKAFIERFNKEEVPLLYVLDTEIGIGYRQDIVAKGVHPYLEDLKMPISKIKQELHIKLNPIQILLNQKLQEVQLEDTTIIKLTDEDCSDYKENWEDIPDTLSISAEIITENKEEKLVLQGYRGSSAANILARFYSDKSEIQDVSKKIAEKEAELNPGYILAEILHLPDARIGNIIRRPTLRSYEIPYLAQSILSKENQISVDDLYVSVRENKIVLRSKKLNKEIKPYLTNSHNYSSNSLPVYHFLCDLHSQDVRPRLQFDWGDLKHLYNFFPRIEYKNIILSKAKWKVIEKEFEQLHEIKDDKTKFLSKTHSWREKRKIPVWVQWVRDDNTLTLNLENYDMLKLFVQIGRKEKTLLIEEFLYNENDNFKREFIFPMYKSKQ